MDDIDLTKLAATAQTVATEHEALTSAITDRQKAEASLLARVVEALTPALPALVSPIRTSERTYWPTSATTATVYDTHDARGIRVDGDGPEQDHPSANEGQYEGKALYLMESGTFAVLRYEGHWSRWQGATSEWEAEVVPLTVEEVPANGWDVDEVVKALAASLASHVGKRTKTTQKARERADKLAALARLL